MRTLSKSKLIAFRQCPKRLWLEIHRSDLRDDSASQAVFQIGYAVGDLAQTYFDQQNTGTNTDPHILGWEEAYQTTTNLLTEGNAPIFEAALRIDGALALADVMLPTRDTGELSWEMLEVKSSTSVKSYHRDDAAIQTFIATEKGIPISKVTFTFAYEDSSSFHARSIQSDNGWKISLDRGLDIFQRYETGHLSLASVKQEERLTKECEITYLKFTSSRRLLELSHQ